MEVLVDENCGCRKRGNDAGCCIDSTGHADAAIDAHHASARSRYTHSFDFALQGLSAMPLTGIIGAMHDEVAHLIASMQAQPGYACHAIGMRDYHRGAIDGQACVVVLARLGKVAAAATAVTLIQAFAVDEVVFTGLAGGLADAAKVGDVVIGASLAQHDMDARPFFAQHEVPLLGLTSFPSDAGLCAELAAATTVFLHTGLHAAIGEAALGEFGITAPALHRGLILSGDQFIGDPAQAGALRDRFPEALAVEMEGAAVAQVCHEHGVPQVVLRVISDRADANAHVDFGSFLARVASQYSDGILRAFFAARRLRHAAPGQSAERLADA
jgi:adenosylhomocysteine nucleosidase